jgi:hypothetical protein
MMLTRRAIIITRSLNYFTYSAETRNENEAWSNRPPAYKLTIHMAYTTLLGYINMDRLSLMYVLTVINIEQY